ncbi:glycosyltransferase [Parapedobacter sp. GCM10030251]|uniref:glycosyltransferase n=1 Tax=Parapedobacter sp. GCM10030251 TaxID=3273419 RepID=UPI00361933BF
MKENGISIIMPTYNQGAFISRAMASLFAQNHQEWELIIINDGSTDYTLDTLAGYLKDDRIRYVENATNQGLGKCLNQGFELASFPYICYLPSDDIYYADHLSLLCRTLRTTDTAVLCYSDMNCHYQDTSNGSRRLSSVDIGNIHSLQLVQVMHKKTGQSWMERDELVTDDLHRMFWSKLATEGTFVGTREVSCEWVDHPHQRHKIIRESHLGGIYHYKRYYQVNKAIRFHSTVGNYIDEIEEYKPFRWQPLKQDQLKILVVGELGYNPERLHVLEQFGHQLYGLWIDSPHSYNAVGHFAFGNIVNLDMDNSQVEIERIKPDIIYALLNYQAVPLANYVMRANPSIPFVWHFKEGPFFCRSFGLWKELTELYCNADGRIYINPENKQWYSQFIPDSRRPTLVLDGDLPPSQWFGNKVSSLLSFSNNAIHTVSSGRPYGITPTVMAELARNNIHLHLYGDYMQTSWVNWIEQCKQVAGGHLHLHKQCKPKDWVYEYSQYDAGWLHFFHSDNHGELMRCTWDDLNYPARMSTLAAAGLPMIQKRNKGHIVATENLVGNLDMGVFFDSIGDLAAQLKNKKRMAEIRANVWKNRHMFSFDHYAERLVEFFKEVIRAHKNQVNEESSNYDREAI